MARLISFLNVSIDGCYADANGDMGFAHHDDAEMKAFTTENAKRGGMLLFGRLTYELMIRYWPTPLAAKHDPAVAERMNAMPKVVFSRTLEKAAWQNTRLVASDALREVRKLKRESPLDMATLGSGRLVAALAAENLVDEYQMLVNPVVLGDGKRVFAGVHGMPPLALRGTRAFKNGSVLLTYEPV
jgi:dihydrofolate reductase